MVELFSLCGLYCTINEVGNDLRTAVGSTISDVERSALSGIELSELGAFKISKVVSENSSSYEQASCAP